jgi:hypothetical protein
MNPPTENRVAFRGSRGRSRGSARGIPVHLSETAHKRDHTGDRQRLAWLHLEGQPLDAITRELPDRIMAKRADLKPGSIINRYLATVQAILRKAHQRMGLAGRRARPAFARGTRAPDPMDQARRSGRLLAALPRRRHGGIFARARIAAGERHRILHAAAEKIATLQLRGGKAA